MLEPCYDNGGDAFDYAVDDGVLHVGVFDAMGHGLAAAGVAAFALSAYRHSRRRGCGLLETYAAMDQRGRRSVPRRALRHGRHRAAGPRDRAPAWISAGHPPPLIIRDGRLSRTLTAPPAAPLGIPLAGRRRSWPRVVGARRPAAALHRWPDRGASRRRAACSRSWGSASSSSARPPQGRPHPRRCAGCGTPSSTAAGTLKDDATAVLVEWRRGGETDLLPPTAR